jgi:putative ABC transport system ATP-binding protein
VSNDKPATATDSTEPAIHVHDLHKRFGATTALSGATFDVARGEFVALVGPSGSGKSTLLNLLAALDAPNSGEIVVNGHVLGRHHARHLSHYRRDEVGLVFQLHNLIPRLTARENVETAMYGTHRGRGARRDRSTELLTRLDMADRLDETPPTLSGGERQRVAVARALANEPAVILADEPTGSLDDDSADLVLAMFDELVAAGTTVLAVSHDVRLNERTHRLVKIVEGKVA